MYCALFEYRARECRTLSLRDMHIGIPPNERELSWGRVSAVVLRQSKRHVPGRMNFIVYRPCDMCYEFLTVQIVGTQPGKPFIRRQRRIATK